ncbi:Cell surface mannoprotein MP65 [Penicillium frequentans]|uniref:Cell surface mannoprotein MP65 n=1 Tax=Penicillium frequentans TaxID=3151616 RepID=A0AAD6CRZ9_9EURO|nr:Cell surface mannoprotein MP65 [Penicillium glabrum]
MKHFTRALLALLLTSSGVHAVSQDSNQCLGELHGESQARTVSEVVVVVNENGEPIHTKTRLVLATTPASQANPSKTLPTQLQTSTSSPDVPQTPLAQTKPQDDMATNDATSSERKQKKPPSNGAPHLHEPQHPEPPHIEAPAHPEPAHPEPPHIEAPAHPEPAHPEPPHHEQPPHPEQPHPEPPQHPEPAQHPKPNTDPTRQFGISYSPYNADRSCKTQDRVNQDLDLLSQYKFIRIYGTDCEQATLVARAARLHKMQVFGGIYDLTDFPASLNAFKEAATTEDGSQDWSVFHTIAVGNELVNGGRSTPAEVSGAITQARTYLRGQGYKGPVVTVDTFSVLLKHPELCIASDYCAANCHAFFDATQQPHNAGPYVLGQMHAVSAAAGGKHTIITESGWPHAGQANGDATPSPENQRVAVESLRKSFGHRGG